MEEGPSRPSPVRFAQIISVATRRIWETKPTTPRAADSKMRMTEVLCLAFWSFSYAVPIHSE